MSLLLKFLLLFLLPYFFISVGCVKSKNKTDSVQTETVYHPNDTLQKIRIDSIVEQINVGVKAQGNPTLMPFSVYHPNDTLRYWTVNDEPERISLNMYSGETIIWPTFYISNGQLVLV